MYTTARTPPVALSIAGSDSGGGAGIQADLKAFAANGVFGTTALTAITAQNTRGVTAIELLSPSLLEAQLKAVLTDFQVRAVKTGMLGSPELLEVVARYAERDELPRLVVDPVMVATSGDRLSSESIADGYRDHLFKQALVITPNVTEAEILSENTISNVGDMVRAARILHHQGAHYVYVKGGHLPGPESIDIFFDGVNVSHLRAPRVTTNNIHGTGCTFSATLAALLARGKPIEEAVRQAKTYTTRAIVGSSTWVLGHGGGPLDHFGWASRHYS